MMTPSKRPLLIGRWPLKSEVDHIYLDTTNFLGFARCTARLTKHVKNEYLLYQVAKSD
jgi:hypothetical protein